MVVLPPFSAPPISVSPQFSFVLEGLLKTDKLEHDVAFFSLSFFDAGQQLLETHETRHERESGQWTKLRIDPIQPRDPNTRLAIVGVHLKPTDRADLRGAAQFDDMWLARLPRMTLSANSDNNVYARLGQIEISCQVSGFPAEEPTLHFELLDETGQLRAAVDQSMEGEIVEELGGRRSSFSGRTIWRPPIDDYGFYRARVSMPETSGLIHTRTMTLAVLHPASRPRGGHRVKGTGKC